MADHYVTEEEIAVERSPAELAAWVRSKFDQIAGLPGGKQAVRYRKGLCKALVEEVYPLSIWATQRFAGDKNVRLLPVIGNQTFDALVKDYGKVPPEVTYVEITQAHEGEPEHLRMIMLERDQWAWGSAKFEKRGTKKTGIEIKVRRALVSKTEVVQELVEFLRDSILRKVDKPYPAGTELVVMFEDKISVREAVEDIVRNFYENEVVKLKLPFRRVYFVGWFKGIYLTRDLLA
jgi:hypothetical protein